jgi:4-hydroxybenzoyl-CoA thioesterase
MVDVKHFSIRSLPSDESELDKDAHRPDVPAFQSDEIVITPWATDYTGHLQASRFFELINVAVEQWFPRTLGMNFHELHTVHSGGIPTVVMRTRCRELPRVGETVTMWIRPTKVGEKSLEYTTWLVRDGVCLIENEQVIVFVKLTGRDFKTISIPDGVRQQLQEQYVAT